MSDESARPQDVDRSHHRKGSPSAATRSLLAEYQEAMRRELRGLLAELEPAAPAPGLLPDVPAAPIVLPIERRARLWDLAIRLGRELGSEVDATPLPSEAPVPARPRRRARVDW